MHEYREIFTKLKLHSHQDYKLCFKKKASSLRLYLPRLKWTMNKTLIFFRIRSMFLKSNESEAEFTKIKMKKEQNHEFLQNLRYV